MYLALLNLICFLKHEFSFFDRARSRSEVDLDRSRSRLDPISIYYDFLLNTKIDSGTMFFEISAQNDPEWWSSCPKLIDVLISCLNSELAGWRGLMISVSTDFGSRGEDRFNKSRGVIVITSGA